MATIVEALALGLKLHQRGELPRAESIYREVLARQPRHAEALHLLGVLALQTSRPGEAITMLEQSVAIDPDTLEHLSNLASAYLAVGRNGEALTTLDRVLARDPHRGDAHYSRGLALSYDGRADEAMAEYRRCLALLPDYVPALGNLGVLLQAEGMLDEAEQSFERAMTLDPKNATTHFNRGTLAKDRGDPAKAIAHYDQALGLDPGHAQARAARGVALLSLGQFLSGWQDYEHRVRCPQFNTLKFPQPTWDGSPLEGRTLLIHCEQGLGDTLQFIRYVKPIVSQGGKVVVAAHAALIPLLTESGLGGLIPREGPLEAFDVHAPLLSLPRILGTDAANVPHDVPYLAAPPERIARWQTELARHPGMKIGIACQGQKNFRGDRFRSLPVEHFARLAQIPSVRLVSLQKEPHLAEAGGGNVPFEVIDFGDALDRSGAFLDSAAIIKCLDLVVTSDTAIAHLAGALGARVWVALSMAPDWRWMLGRDDSPWYPTMRLFRQRRRGDWRQVFEDLARELRGMIERGES